MLGVPMYITIKTLWKQGYNKSEIQRITKHDWKTVNKIIKQIQNGQEFPIKKSHPKKLDDFKLQIIQWLESDLSGVRIHEKLQEIDFKICYSSVKNYINTLKVNNNICIRFHTSPGEEAQVDFGYVGLTPDNTGKLRKTWVFNMRLSYSRLDYYEKVYNQKVETFIQCHVNAFKYYGGVPSCVRIDNLKSAILKANFYEPIYQSLYKQCADYYGFKIIPCRVRKPQEKGKVEAGIKYFKKNFMAGRTFVSSDDMDAQILDWLNNKCNVRVHGTTRAKPIDLFNNIEKAALMPLPELHYMLPKVGERLVYTDCHVYIDYNYYSVPAQYVGKTVYIEIKDSLVKIYYENQQIALHNLLINQGEFATQPSHYPVYKNFNSSEYKATYKTKMADIGEHAEKIYFILIQEQPHHWYNTISGILSLKKQFDNNTINLSCARALAYGAIQYRKIKNICESGLYNLPIDFKEAVH